MSNAPTPASISTIDVDGSSISKRRLSDASEDSNPASKSKKLIGADGKLVKDGSNKTKSGRFKPGAPVDLDEQCGVITDKNVACSRSLTCKTHGVGAKRSVPGRTKAFDTLLTEFQKKKENRIKQREKEAALNEKNMGAFNPNTSMEDAGNAGNISVPSINKASFDDGDDIAVPQAGSSSSHQVRLLSPSPLNSIPVPSPSNMEDIQVQQPAHELFQHSSQPSSRPHSNPVLQSQPSRSSNIAVPPPSQHQQQQPQAQSQQQQPQQQLASHSNAPASLPAKMKPNLISLSGTSNASPLKGNVSATGTVNGMPVPVKKKKAGEGGKTGKNKVSARTKADLVLGEVDDPPEPTNMGVTSSTLVGADGQFIVEEEAPDSDDEADQLLVAVTQSRARPLALPTFPPYERTPMKLAKYRESFLTAFTGRSMSSSAS